MLKFGEASRNSKRSINWKFKLSISLGTQKSAKNPPAVGKMIRPFELEERKSVYYWKLSFQARNAHRHPFVAINWFFPSSLNFDFSSQGNSVVRMTISDCCISLEIVKKCWLCWELWIRASLWKIEEQWLKTFVLRIPFEIKSFA